jgi:tetratricopeptide (TPR) repeat protein
MLCFAILSYVCYVWHLIFLSLDAISPPSAIPLPLSPSLSLSLSLPPFLSPSLCLQPNSPSFSWEIACTRTTSAKLTIQFSPSERLKFQKVLKSNFRYIMKALSSIDVESSEAWNPHDKEMIFDAVRRADGGFLAVNMIIFEVLREWLAESGRLAMNYSDDIYQTGTQEEIRDNLYLMNAVGQLMKEQGRYSEAEHLYRLAIHGYSRLDKLGLAPNLTDERDSEDSSREDHLATENNLAILLNLTGRRAEAEILFKGILQSYERKYGPDDRDTLSIKNNLANIYNEKGDKKLAANMYREVLDGYLRSQGKENEETLSCMHNLATVLNDEGRAAEAEAMMREVRDIG